MEIYAKGKNIPTYDFGDLFIQGERFAVTIVFVVDRVYSGIDLAGCAFIMSGVTSEGWQAVQALSKEIGEDKIRLTWNVSEDFTLNSGQLRLSLRASEEYGSEDHIVKYSMQPVNVLPVPNGRNGPLPETAEQLISQINEAAAAGLESIQEEIDAFDLEAVEARLDQIEADTATYLARPEVIPMTQEEYDRTVHKQNSLYVIIEEDE